MNLCFPVFKLESFRTLHSQKLTWKPQKSPIKTTGLLKRGYVSFHVSLEWKVQECAEMGALTMSATHRRFHR